MASNEPDNSNYPQQPRSTFTIRGLFAAMVGVSIFSAMISPEIFRLETETLVTAIISCGFLCGAIGFAIGFVESPSWFGTLKTAFLCALLGLAATLLLATPEEKLGSMYQRSIMGSLVFLVAVIFASRRT